MKTERLEIRITPELKSQLQALAAADGRSLSNYITRILESETKKNAPAE